MSHPDVAPGKDWPRRIGVVILVLTSLVIAGIVTAAYRGKLFGTTTGYGAIALPLLVLGQLLTLRRNPLAALIAGLFALSAAFFWLQAVTI